MGEFNVFVSGVSDEFRASRDQVASDLRARRLTVRVQQDFRQESGTDTTLRKLHNYIRDCQAVICIIGVRSGEKPTRSEAAPFADMLPEGVSEASYTQWEFYFARHYQRRLSLYVAKNRYQRAPLPKGGKDFPDLQRGFVEYIVTALGLDRDYFANTDQLCRLILREDWPNERGLGRSPVHHLMDSWGLAWSFQRVLDERWEHFWGREWLFAEIRAAMEKVPASRLFIVSGLPGSGKSAIATSFIDNEHCGPVIAFHCCQRDRPETLDPRGFVRNLAFMLAQELPDYRDALDRMPVDSEIFTPNSDVGAAQLLSHLVFEPLRALPPPKNGGKLWIVVDALDEAEEAGEFITDGTDKGRPTDTIATVLASELGRIPSWLRILATGRPNVVRERLTGLFSHDGHDLVQRFQIDDKTFPDDIKASINGRLKAAGLALPADAKRTLAERSNGNMLYAKRVLDGLIQRSAADIRDLPPGLDALYFRELSYRYPSARLAEYERITGPLFAAVIAANEQLTVDMLSRIVDVSSNELREALKRLSDYFSSIGGRYRIYHKSFEDWLLDPGRAKHFAVDRAAGHKLLGTYCWRSFYAHRSQSEVITDIDSEDWRYTIRFGVEHLVQSGNLDQAVELLSFIYERWDEERVAGTTFATLRPPLLVRAVFRALADCAPEAKQKIEPFDLIPLLKSFYQIEPLAAPIEILVRFHRTKWPDILDELLQEEENYVLRYAISQILGSICTERDAPISLSDISSYLNRPELVYRELGAYALRHLYGRKPELIKLEHLERMGDDETYSGRAALGDLLLNVELQKRYDSTRVQSTLFWKPIWPYNSIDVWDLGAVRLLRAGKSPSNDTDEHVKEAYENLEQTEALRKRLLEEERIKADETVCGLVKDFYQLGLNPRRLRNARNRVKGSPHMLDLLRLAFSHPLWNVAEEAASELASFVEREPQMISAVETLLQESYWRVRFGATETAYQLASGDDIGLFGKAVARFHNDPNPRLRALCAENLIAYILDRHGDRRAKLLGDFSDAICCWIGEGDAWLLEHVFRLLTALAKDGEDVEALIPNPVPYLLDGLDDWSTLSRTAFLIHIEKRQRARGTQAVTAAA